MTENNSTIAIEEKLTEQELSRLRRIRRAAMAIRSCSEILNEHEACKESLPGRPGVFITVEVNQAEGLRFAMEACALGITDSFDAEEFDGLGILDEICPEVTKESILVADLNSGAISIEDFRKAVAK